RSPRSRAPAVPVEEHFPMHHLARLFLVAALCFFAGRPAAADTFDLFVSSPNDKDVVRFNGKTGAFRSVFVAPGSGGLQTPEGLAFGPDGNLFVADQAGNRILRYDGVTGAFLGVFTPSLQPELENPRDLVFGP